MNNRKKKIESIYHLVPGIPSAGDLVRSAVTPSSSKIPSRTIRKDLKAAPSSSKQRECGGIDPRFLFSKKKLIYIFFLKKEINYLE